MTMWGMTVGGVCLSLCQQGKISDGKFQYQQKTSSCWGNEKKWFCVNVSTGLVALTLFECKSQKKAHSQFYLVWIHHRFKKKLYKTLTDKASLHLWHTNGLVKLSSLHRLCFCRSSELGSSSMQIIPRICWYPHTAWILETKPVDIKW